MTNINSIEELLAKNVIRIRTIEEEIANEYSNQEMRCPVHLSIGQEACAVGICANLNKEDYFESSWLIFPYFQQN